jgi:UDP-N-acetylmuramate--alanine ligase
VVVGGIIKGKSQAQLGKKDYLVCEADESDRSFLRLFPSYAVITNIEEEHLDHYNNLEDIKKSFIYFATHVPFWGVVFLCADSVSNLEILNKIRRRTLLYGINTNAELRCTRIRKIDDGSAFRVKYGNKSLGEFSIHLLGRHNIANALAAIGVGLELGISTKVIRSALENFSGVKRRIEYVGAFNHTKVFDDYGHHPTEIAATLETLRDRFPHSRIISIFQPHRYSRTYYLFEQLGICFLNADIVVVTEIYGAHEIPIVGISGRALAKRISKEQDSVYFISRFEDIVKFIKKTARPGDLIVIQGAGNINKIISLLFNKKRGL